jgi:hypothetical protein
MVKDTADNSLGITSDKGAAIGQFATYDVGGFVMGAGGWI